MENSLLSWFTLHFLFAYDFVPAIGETSLVDRYSPIPRNISSDQQSVDTSLADRLTLGMAVGSLQRQVAAQG
jgi:hypothetical protein